jgi:sensor c-di-GMP phosphodiesterase-like protein
MQRRRRLAISALALLGAVVGTCGGFWLAHGVIVRAAIRGLSDYAEDLVRHADEYGRELTEIRHRFDSGPASSFCSPQEIAAMQAMTFRSLQVKEIGRMRDGKLYCSAFLGRLSSPYTLPRPTMTLPGGAAIYGNIPIQIAGSDRGTIIASGGINAVLSPTAFDHWGRPHLRYMVAIINSKTHQMVTIAGEALPVTPAWALSEGQIRASNVFYRSRCSRSVSVCVVTAESIVDMGAGSDSLLLGYSGMGCLAGLGISLAIALFYLQRMGLAQQLRRAIRRDSIQIVYQPVLDLQSRRWSGMEALLRWSDQDGAPVPTDLFIRIAESRSFIGDITALVIRKATREVGDLLRQNPELTLSINIASTDLAGESLFVLLDVYVRQAGIAPEQIALELTERSTSDMDVVREAVLRLHRHGYKVHIDDFGTGFSSLSYLHELAVDAIKVDRSFTRTIGTDAVTVSILPQILSLAEALQLDVIVEGVETETQADYLISTHKQIQAQGWYFGYPVSSGELHNLRRHSEKPVVSAAAESIS